MFESCFLGCGWDCSSKTFAYPLSDASRLRKAQELLSELTRAPLVASFCWQQLHSSQPPHAAFLPVAPSTPTHSTSRHSLGYAGMGAWLERLLRATAQGAGDARNSTGSAGDRSSLGGAADRSSFGANSVHGSVGWGGVGCDAGDGDKVEVDVWCGPLSVVFSVQDALAFSANVVEHTQPLVELLSHAGRGEWDADDADSFASCTSSRAGAREQDAWPPHTMPSSEKPMVATRVCRVCVVCVLCVCVCVCVVCVCVCVCVCHSLNCACADHHVCRHISLFLAS